MTLRTILLLCFAAAFATGSPADAAFLRVDPAGGGDYLTVAQAMAAASSGDTIATIAGNHVVTSVEVKEGVELLGGWDSSFTIRTPGTSHFTPSGGGTILRLVSGQTTATLIDGIEFSGATSSAILCTSSDATITNNEFHNNSGQDGAAVHCEYGASPLIEFNYIHHNSAVYGGGLRGHWGSDTSPTIRHNLIEYNQAFSAGGGIGVNNGNPIIEDNIIRYNNADGTGGGIHVWHAGGGTVEIRRNLVIENTCRDGAGIGINGGHPVIENNTIWGNSAWQYGGAISQAESIEPDPGITQIHRNILGGSPDGAGVHCINEFDVSLSCNCVYNNADGTYVNCPPPVNDFYADPLFCNLIDFGIRSNSLCAPSSPTGCGLVGAVGVQCGPVSISATSWGQIKAAYR